MGPELESACPKSADAITLANHRHPSHHSSERFLKLSWQTSMRRHILSRADVAAPLRSSATTPCPSRHASIRCDLLHFLLADKTWDNENAPTSASGTFCSDFRVYSLGKGTKRRFEYMASILI